MVLVTIRLHLTNDMIKSRGLSRHAYRALESRRRRVEKDTIDLSYIASKSPQSQVFCSTRTYHFANTLLSPSPGRVRGPQSSITPYLSTRPAVNTSAPPTYLDSKRRSSSDAHRSPGNGLPRAAHRVPAMPSAAHRGVGAHHLVHLQQQRHPARLAVVPARLACGARRHRRGVSAPPSQAAHAHPIPRPGHGARQRRLETLLGPDARVRPPVGRPDARDIQ